MVFYSKHGGKSTNVTWPPCTPRTAAASSCSQKARAGLGTCTPRNPTSIRLKECLEQWLQERNLKLTGH